MRVPMTHQCRDTVPVPSMGTPAVCTRQDGWFCEKWWEGVRDSQRLYKVWDFHLHSIIPGELEIFWRARHVSNVGQSVFDVVPLIFDQSKTDSPISKNQISNQRKSPLLQREKTIIQKQYTKCLHYLTLPSHLHSKRRTLKIMLLITHTHHSQAPLDIPSDDNWCYSWWKVSAHLRFISAQLIGNKSKIFDLKLYGINQSDHWITQNDLRLQINLSCSKTIGTFYSSFPMNKVVLQPSNVNKLRLLMKIMLCREVLIPLDPQVDSNSKLHI